MSPSELVFHRFRDLPTELRLSIWRECLPQRVVELDFVFCAFPECDENDLIRHRNKAPPLITRVCRESRQVALETGRQLPGFPDPDNPDDTRQFTRHMVENPWLDAARDVVHINWDPEVDIDWRTHGWGNPVGCVASYAARTEVQQASIRLEFLQYIQYVARDDYRWTSSQLASLMRAQAPSLSWTVVIMDPIVVHGTTAADSGLFGLLGDAPVQLVDASDERRIDEFLGLGNRPGGTISPQFELDELIRRKGGLRDVVDAIFGSGKPAPAMHPAVMFRLCTEECGQDEDEDEAFTLEN